MTLRVLIVPLRDFETAKTRLGDVLTASRRSDLARLCAQRVLTRDVDCHRIVVCDSDSVEKWARDLEVDTVRVTTPGLNAALSEALPTIRSRHPDADVIIAHGDIVEPAGLDDLITPTSQPDSARVVIVPDSRRDGTNVLRIDSTMCADWTFQYGPASFSKHLQQAQSRGWSVRVHHDAGLATDLDTREDLGLPLVRSFLSRNFPDWEIADPSVGKPPRRPITHAQESS